MSDLAMLERRIALNEIPAAGLAIHWDLSEAERAALARHAGILAVEDLSVRGRLVQFGEGAKADLELTGRAVQACVVTLEPVEEVIRERTVRLFLPPELVPEPTAGDIEIAEGEDDPPDPIIDGGIDLAPVVAEHFILALNPYPRVEGASVPAEATSERISPFAAIGSLKDKG